MVSPSIIILVEADMLKHGRRISLKTLTWRYRSNDALLLLWASRASIPAFSSYRLHEYHAVPCSLQGPIHTQQNSCLHFLQVIWLKLEYVIGKVSSSTIKKKPLLAATVLLDRTLTLRAFLGVGLDPIGCFTVVPTFLQPILGNCTY